MKLSPLKIVLIVSGIVLCIAVIITLAVVLTRCSSPETIEPAKSINVTEIDEALKIEWTPTAPVGSCSISYKITVRIQDGHISRSAPEPSFILMRSLFCYSSTFIIDAIVGSTIAQIGNQTIRYEVPAPTELQLSVSSASGTITATWSRPSDSTYCNVFIAGTLTRGTISTRLLTYDNSVTYDLYYCVETSIIIVASTVDHDLSEARTASIPAEYPTSLRPPEDISISITGNSAIVSWQLPTSVSQCTGNLYTVRAKHGTTGVEAQCQGTSNCAVVLNTFCPSTEFTIRPTSVQGEPVVKIYSC